jgi:hypothetical protein
MMSRLATLAFLLAVIAPQNLSASNLAVTQTSATPSYASGSKGMFSTQVQNLGPGAVASVTVDIRFGALSGTINVEDIDVDPLPAEFTCGAVYADAQGWHLPCSAASLPQGYSATIVTRPTMTGTSGNMNVCSSIAPTATDPDTANNSSCVGVTVTVPQADQSLTIIGSATSPVSAGTSVTYTIDFRNDGPDAASNAVLSTKFTALNGTADFADITVVSKPAELTCGAAFPSAQGPTINCTAPSLPNGYTGQVVFSATSIGAGQEEVCTTISSATNDSDSNGLLNSGCVVLTIIPAAEPTSTSLSCGGSVTAGSTGTGTVTLSATQLTDTTITLASNNTSAATVPASVIIPAGTLSANFTITGVAAGDAIITATPPIGLGTAQTCQVSITAAAPVTISLGGNTCPLTTIGVGTSATITVTIGSQQGSPTTITLTSSNPGVATVPPSVIIPTGATSATFDVTGVGPGSSSITATAPDSIGGATVSCTTNVEGRATAEVAAVPALSPLALALTAALLAVAGFFVITRQAS